MKDRYPTPDMPEEITFTTRCVTIPNIPEFIALVGGLLFQPTQAHFWYEFGSMDVETATTAMQDALAFYDAEDECPLSCEEIIDCIENNPETGEALMQWLSDNGFGTPSQNGTGTPNNAGIYESNPLLIDGSTIEDCDNDNLFGAITQLVDFVNRRIVDVFEIIESETNIIERSQIALEAFPITDTLAADSAAAFADQLAEEIAEGYDAAFTEELEDEYRCDLFCLVKDTCELSFQTFADYFNGRIGNTPPTVAFSEYIEWFITGDFVGSNIVDAAYSVVFAALSYGADAMGINIGALLTSINAALNDPNPDWALLCEDCPPDVFIPVIGQECTVSPEDCGTIISEVSVGVWRITSTVRASSDVGITLSDQFGRAFQISSAVYVSGVTIAAFTRAVDPTCTIENGFGLGIGVPVRTWLGVQGGTTNFTYDFTIALV